MKKRKDFGSPVLIIALILILVLLLIGRPALVYDETQTMELTSYGLYDNGNSEYDALEFYAISRDYESEFLTIPAYYGTMVIDSINATVFQGTPVRYVLLPDTIGQITFSGNPEITMFTDDARLAAMCEESGFSVDTGENYHRLVKSAQRISCRFRNIATNFEALAGTYWLLVLVPGLYILVLLCARWREKAGFDNPLVVLKKSQSITNAAFMIVQFAAAFLTFYWVLYYTEEIGLDSDWLLDIMMNWPLKIAIGLFCLVLFSDIFNKNFFPWFFGRVIVRCVRVVIPAAIAAALGAFIGTVSNQFRFIVHLIAAAPLPIFFIGGGIMAAVIYGKLGVYTPDPDPIQPSAESDTPPAASILPNGTVIRDTNGGSATIRREGDFVHICRKDGTEDIVYAYEFDGKDTITTSTAHYIIK